MLKQYLISFGLPFLFCADATVAKYFIISWGVSRIKCRKHKKCKGSHKKELHSWVLEVLPNPEKWEHTHSRSLYSMSLTLHSVKLAKLLRCLDHPPTPKCHISSLVHCAFLHFMCDEFRTISVIMASFYVLNIFRGGEMKWDNLLFHFELKHLYIVPNKQILCMITSAPSRKNKQVI